MMQCNFNINTILSLIVSTHQLNMAMHQGKMIVTIAVLLFILLETVNGGVLDRVFDNYFELNN